MERSRSELIQVLKAALLQIFPVLGRRLLPVKGKVVAVYHRAGRAGDTGVYAVDVQPLDASGQPAGPVLPHLTLPTLWVGEGRGILVVPAAGTLVRVAWYESGEPYLDAVLPDGVDIPAQAAGSLFITFPAGRIQVTADGQVWISSTEAITLTSDTVTVEGDLVVTGVINP